MAPRERRQFDERSSKRIANAVRKIESLHLRGPQRSGTRPRFTPNLRLGKTYEPIAHDAEGLITLYVGPVAEETSAERVKAINKFAPLRANEWVLLAANARGYYVVERGSARLILFQLTDTLVKGGSAPAKKRNWNGAAWTGVGGEDITVFDSSEFGPAAVDKFGVAEFNDVSERYEIVSLHRGGVELIRFYLNGNLEQGGDAAAQVMEWTGALWQPNAAPPITVFDSSDLGPAEATQTGNAWLCEASGRAEIITLRNNDRQLVFLGRATADADNEPDIPTVDVEIVTDVDGLIPWLVDGSPVQMTVSLLPHGGIKSNVKYGDVIAFSITFPLGDAIVAVSDYSVNNAGQLLWAKATAKWVNNPGNGSYVVCHKALDKDGTLDLDEEEQPQEITVYLPRPGGNVDPNVRTNDVIGYELDNNGLAIATTDYLDDAIGTVVMWVKSEEEIRGGWRIYGPSPARFPVGVTTSDEDIPATIPGTTGGEKKHFHDYETDSITTFETELELEDHTGLETQPTNLTLLPHIGYYTDEATVIIQPAGPFTAYISGETDNTAPGITGTGVVAVSGTGTASTSSVALTTQSGGGGSASLSGETGDNITLGFQILDHENHWHQANASAIVQAWSSGTVRYAYSFSDPQPTTVAQSTGGQHLSHSITDLKHRHTLDATVTVSSHTHGINSHNHTVAIADIAGGLSVDGAEIASLLTVASHNHGFSNVPVTIPAHTHYSLPHFHAIPSMEHSLSPNPHNHGMNDLEHELSPNPHDHRMRNTPEEKHIPPWFGIHFIERYE